MNLCQKHQIHDYRVTTGKGRKHRPSRNNPCHVRTGEPPAPRCRPPSTTARSDEPADRGAWPDSCLSARNRDPRLHRSRIVSHGLIRLAVAAVLLGVLFWSQYALEEACARQDSARRPREPAPARRPGILLVRPPPGSWPNANSNCAPTADERDKHAVAIFTLLGCRPAGGHAAEFDKPVPDQVPERRLPATSPDQPKRPPSCESPIRFQGNATAGTPGTGDPSRRVSQETQHEELGKSRRLAGNHSMPPATG